MTSLFEDNSRFKRFHLRFGDILLDFSKNIITEETISLLVELAKACSLKEAIYSMFHGDKINETEKRAVLHVALRNKSGSSVNVDGKDVMPEINAELQKVKDFSEKIISGRWKGFSGKPIKNIVNIGFLSLSPL